VDYDFASNSIIFVKSSTNQTKDPKRPAWISKPFESEYTWDNEEEEEWASKEMKDQITGTVSAIQAKPLKDIETAYFVLGVESHFIPNENMSKIRKQIFYQNTLTVLKRLQAEILCYLNPQHSKLLISCPLSKLQDLLIKEKFKTEYFKTVKRISPLLNEEQFSDNLKDESWAKESREVIIEIIPNLPAAKKQEYSQKLVESLKSSEDIEAEGCCNGDFVITSIDKQSAESLLKITNFIFRVHEVPTGLLNSDESLSNKKRHAYTNGITGKGSMALQGKLFRSLPIVCVLDSGVDPVPSLKGLLVTRDGFRKFPSLDDDFGIEGHGTPVAQLAAFGERNVSVSRIISYKIYSNTNKLVYPEGYKLALAKYSAKVNPNYAPIFVSSIVFEKYNDRITALIDQWIQENNACVVFSAGNIESELVNDYAYRGVPCASYICNHPIQDPGQGVNGLAIGSIAKRDSSNSIVRKNELSPFTRCGVVNSSLYDCKKPEFVQHGGNYCKDGSALGVKSVNKSGVEHDNFIGTSFAAPIFANRLAEIYANYGDKYQNSETLKAIAFALSYGELQECRGFGETKPLKDFNYDLQTIVCSEGSIPLTDNISDDKFKLEYFSKISVAVPKLVNCIKMFLVHSDNQFREVSPHLNTYLTVNAKKTARDYGYADLSNKDENYRKSNMKIFKWAYESQSMEGTWDFYIKPEITTDLLAEHKRSTSIRYGCAILINSKTLSRDEPLTEQVYALNKQLGVLR
jgi:hypothetical protein